MDRNIDDRLDQLLARLKEDTERVQVLLKLAESRDPRRGDAEGGERKN